MGLNLRILLLVFSMVWGIFVLILLKKEKIPVKYSMVWFLVSIIIALVSIFPKFLLKITHMFGFETISNMIIGIIITLLMVVTIVLTIIVSNQNKLIKDLIQEVSIIKGKIKHEK